MGAQMYLSSLHWKTLDLVLVPGKSPPLIELFPAATYVEYAPTPDDTDVQKPARVTTFLHQLTNLTALKLTLDIDLHRDIAMPDMRQLTQLRALSLCDNTLATAPLLLPLTDRLTELDLSGQVQRLGNVPLRGFTALRSLTVIKNPYLKPRVFDEFSSLTRLDWRGHQYCQWVAAGKQLFDCLRCHTGLTSLTIHAADFACMLRLQTPQELIAEQLPSVTQLTVLDHYQSETPFPRHQ